MDSLSKQELISTITKQADQIKRYEARLRDVVAAYKGLAKEKEALEISLKALNRTENESETSKDDSVATLTLSLSTLAEEKSRLEEAFQADKKVTREKYENQLAALRDDNRKLVQQHLAEVNNLKAKIAYEIQERENERADHTAMLKELQMKLNSERITKEQFEEKYADSTESQATQGELEARVRELGASLAGARRRLARAQARAGDSPAALLRLRDQLALLEQSHALALREEQIKTNRAEESARKTCARQEERVALLEGKVAELSQTIGEYDARRRRDEQIILQLKESLNGRLIDRIHSRSVSEEPQPKSETDNDKLADSEYLQTLIDKIHILKKELIAENEKLGTPIDLPTIFKLEGYENMHVKCRDEYERLKEEFDLFKKLHSVPTRTDDVEMEIANLKSEVIVLKEKVEMYVMMLDDEKQEKADTVKYFEKKLKTEQELNKESSAEYKARIQSLETQLQAQRARGAAILREADNYVRARRASRDDCGLTEVSAPPHMLHYAHEVARKDLDISHLRREKHALEGQLRDCQREATIEKERFKEVIRTLKEEIDRLRRIQSREGANLEYLKNVVMAYLMSTDYEGRRHMLNAIAAVLHFTNSEKTAVLSIL